MSIRIHRHRLFDSAARSASALLGVAAVLLWLAADALADDHTTTLTESDDESANPTHPMPFSLLIAAMRAKQRYPATVTVLSQQLEQPWGMALLPDGTLLVTQRVGVLSLLDSSGSAIVEAIQGMPPVAAAGQGGLLDVAVDPDFNNEAWIYWSFTEPGDNAESNVTGTAIARGRLNGQQVEDVSVIFRQAPKLAGTGHYGSRLAFGVDGKLYVTLGDRRARDLVQDLSSGVGKVVRLNRDGSLPADNPEFANGRSAIWSLGHRNPQGAAIHPKTGELWVSEHGPRGGDEVNRVLPGNNYGWPIVSYGCEYGQPIGASCEIGGGTHAPDYAEPVSTWVPTSTAPADMIFYSGNQFPEWENSLLVASLAGRALWRISLNGNSEVGREPLLQDLDERFRDIEIGPDGEIYLLTDSGKLLRYSRPAPSE